METFYLTFASDKAHGNGYVRIVAPSYSAAREAVIDHFATKWSMLYEESKFSGGYFPDGELFAFSTDEDLNYRKIKA